MDNTNYNRYLSVLRDELVPALGCTEPIAIAYAAALARKALGAKPEKIKVLCSPNIVKNVKGVTVPNSGGQKGIQAAAILGLLGGDPDRELEVLDSAKAEHQEETRKLAASDYCQVDVLHGDEGLRLIVAIEGGGHWVEVEISGAHTNVCSVTFDGEQILDQLGLAPELIATGETVQKDFMTVEDIYHFALSCNLDDIAPIIERQIEYNTKISHEGLSKNYGASIGRTLLDEAESSVSLRAQAMAAAGSDARMSGCDLPVVINSGSGNQGIAVSIPVIEYAKSLGVPKEKLLRALVMSNLIAIHQKSGIGKLSAFCGVVSAACGSGAAITYLHGGDFATISNTITNMLGTVSGMVCDGAKPSCAAKIATAVDTALMAHKMAMRGKVFSPGEGLIKDNVEETIQGIGRMAKIGMRSTDEEVLKIMLE